MSIEVMELALAALNEAVVFREGGRQKAIDAIDALHTAIQQAESEPVAALVRHRRIRTPAHCAFDKKDHYSEWSDWGPCTLSYAKAVTDPTRDVGLLPLYEMLPLYTHPAPSVPADVVRDAERGRFLIGWLKRYGLLQTEFGQMGAGEKPENWWLLHAPWGIDQTRPFLGHGKTPEQAIDATMLAAKVGGKQ